MYTLRELHSNEIVTNTEIGRSYQLIHRERVSGNEFEKIYHMVYGTDYDITKHGNCFGFIRNMDLGSEDFHNEYIPLMETTDYYVMCDNGKTFERITP